MSYYNGRIDFETFDNQTFSFTYCFDNEICPKIVVPKDWRSKCSNKDQIIKMVDNFLCDPFWDDYPGLGELIRSFDESLPFDDLKSAPKYDDFLHNIEQNHNKVATITISVLNAHDNSVYQQETLSMASPETDDDRFSAQEDFSDLDHQKEKAKYDWKAELARWEAKADKQAEEWMSKYGKYHEDDPEIEFNGKRFVFSGCHGIDSQRIIQETIKRGGKITQSVSGLTDYLVVNPREAGTVKSAVALEQLKKGKKIKFVFLEDVIKALEKETTADEPSVSAAKSTPKETGAPDVKKKKTVGKTKHFYADLPEITETPAPKPVKKAAPKSKKPADDTGVFKKYTGSDEIVTVPEGTTAIGDRAFAGNTTIKKVIVPTGVKFIGEGAFAGCTSLIEAELPDSVEDIGKGAFKGCVSLESFTVPGNTLNLWKDVLDNCTGLKSLTLHDNVDFIYYKYGMSALSGIKNAVLYAPDGFDIQIIPYGGSMFERVIGTLPDGKSWPVCTLSEAELKERRELKIYGSTLMKYCGDKETFIIPDTIKTIGYNAFLNNKTIKRIVIPNSVSSIADNAFDGCEKLESLEIPYGVKVINRWICQGCKSLRYVTVPETVTKLDYHAFYECTSLKSINIPSGVKFIDSDAIKYSKPGNYKSFWNAYNINISSQVESVLADAINTENHDKPDNYKNLTIYGTPGTLAQKYAEAKSVKFSPGLPYGIPAPRTADTPDPTENAMKEEKARLERERAEREARLKAQEEARRAEQARAEAEKQRVSALNQRIAALNEEKRANEKLIEDNRGWFGEKARIRKAAKARIDEINAEIARLRSQL